jgi:hypothetical protein
MFEQHDAFLSYISSYKETVHELAEGQKKDKQQMWLDLGNHARDLMVLACYYRSGLACGVYKRLGASK